MEQHLLLHSSALNLRFCLMFLGRLQQFSEAHVVTKLNYIFCRPRIHNALNNTCVRRSSNEGIKFAGSRWVRNERKGMR